MHALILRRSGLGLLMGKFRPCLTELSARDMIMARYYSLTFLFLKNFSNEPLCKMHGFILLYQIKESEFEPVLIATRAVLLEIINKILELL